MTPTHIEGHILTVIATANTLESRFIRANGAVAALNQRAIGVSTDEVKSGEPLPVQIDSIVFVTSGSALTVNDLVTSDATGRAIVAGANPINGICLDDAATSGVLVRIKIV